MTSLPIPSSQVGLVVCYSIMTSLAYSLQVLLYDCPPFPLLIDLHSIWKDSLDITSTLPVHQCHRRNSEVTYLQSCIKLHLQV